MRAAREIAAEAGFESIASGGQRSAHGRQRAADQIRRPGKPDAAHGARIERAAQYCADVGGVVREFDGLARCQRRGFKPVETVGGKQLAQQPVLLDWELVAGREGDPVVVAVE